MDKNNSAKRRRKQKILKTTELTSSIASSILSEWEAGDIIRPTPLAKSIILSNGSHPHVDSVKGEFNRVGVAEEILKIAKPLKKDNEVYALQIIEPYESDIDFINFKKEIRQEIAKIHEKLEKLLVLSKLKIKNEN